MEGEGVGKEDTERRQRAGIGMPGGELYDQRMFGGRVGAGVLRNADKSEQQQDRRRNGEERIDYIYRQRRYSGG